MFSLQYMDMVNIEPVSMMNRVLQHEAPEVKHQVAGEVAGMVVRNIAQSGCIRGVAGDVRNVLVGGADYKTYTRCTEAL